MTTGEKLVALSSLSSGTALDHLLSIETGNGGVWVGYCVDMVLTAQPDGLNVAVEDSQAVNLAADTITVSLQATETLRIDEIEINVKEVCQ